LWDKACLQKAKPVHICWLLRWWNIHLKLLCFQPLLSLLPALLPERCILRTLLSALLSSR
jgi:hypothetical protein